MTAKIIDSKQEYIGVSSDEKPVPSEGAEFYCIDTGDTFVCHEDVWVLDLRKYNRLRPI